MFNNRNTIFIILMLTLVFLSCQDRFLEETNPNELSTDSFWKTLDDADAGLTAVYSTLKHENLMAIEAESHRSDLTYPDFGRPNPTNEYYLHTFTSASKVPNQKWDALYKGVYRANQVIDALNELNPTLSSESEKQRSTEIMAQARLLRGVFYFYLYTSFNEGRVIIHKTVPEDINAFTKGLSSAEEVKSFYLEDLAFAKEKLPAQWTGSQNVGRVSAGTASALLGKSFLFEGAYDSSAFYFKDVIENPDYGYELVANVGDNFTTTNEFNQESIFEVSYALELKKEIDVWQDEEGVSNRLNFAFAPSSGGIGGWRLAYPSSWLIMAYKQDPMDTNDPRNLVDDGEGGTRLRTYSLRTSYSIALVDDVDLEYYGLTTAQATLFNNQETAYFRKYTNWETTESERSIVPNPRSGSNIRVIRLSDVYLMYAEALIKGGSDDSGVNEALRFVNRVRHRSALRLLGSGGEFTSSTYDAISYDATALMNHLMYVERPLELAIEGHAIRFLDLRRWGVLKERFTELAKRKYYGEHFDFVNVEGEADTRFQSMLMEGVPPSNDYVPITDYEQSAANFQDDIHAYWPIPSSESVANPNL